MSIKLMSEAWGSSGLTASNKLILLALCDHANDDGVCYPSIGFIASKCDMTTRRVQEHISRLVTMGFLKVEPSYGKSGIQGHNNYFIKLGEGAENDTLANTPLFGKNGKNPMISRVTKTAGEGAENDTPLNHHINHKNLILPNEDFERFWKAYPRHDGKAQAMKVWGKIKPNPELVRTILDAIEKQKCSKYHLQREKLFIPHAATWLNGERWQDDLETETSYCPRYVK